MVLVQELVEGAVRVDVLGAVDVEIHVIILVDLDVLTVVDALVAVETIAAVGVLDVVHADLVVQEDAHQAVRVVVEDVKADAEQDVTHLAMERVKVLVATHVQIVLVTVRDVEDLVEQQVVVSPVIVVVLPDAKDVMVVPAAVARLLVK